MYVIMPLADGQCVRHEVLKSLANQTIKLDLLPITRPAEHFEFPSLAPVFKKKIRTERKGITTCREILRKIITHRNEKYVLHLDSDVILQSNNDIEDLVNFLDGNLYTAAVALNTKNTTIDIFAEHIPLACVLFRVEILKSIKFHNNENNTCNCLMMCKDIRNLNCKYSNNKKWDIRYLDNRKLSEL